MAEDEEILGMQFQPMGVAFAQSAATPYRELETLAVRYFVASLFPCLRLLIRPSTCFCVLVIPNSSHIPKTLGGILWLATINPIGTTISLSAFVYR